MKTNEQTNQEIHQCRHCPAELIPGVNWYPSDAKRRCFRCRPCTLAINKANRNAARINGPKIPKDAASVIRRRQKTLFRQKAAMARHLGIDFTISLADVIWPMHCPYLGTALDYTARGRKALRDLRTIPSFDRINPELGYVPGNVQVISFQANAIKRDYTVDTLVLKAKRPIDPDKPRSEDERVFYASALRIHG